jgi:hypothetical protein
MRAKIGWINKERNARATARYRRLRRRSFAAVPASHMTGGFAMMAMRRKTGCLRSRRSAGEEMSPRTDRKFPSDANL